MYSTVADVKRKITADMYNKITDPKETGQTREQIMEGAIESADDIINGYLKGFTSERPIPEAKVPVSIRDCSIYIAVYELHVRTQFDTIPDFIVKIHDDKIKFLEAISTGKANLNIELEDGKHSGKVKATSNPRIMGRGIF